MSALCVQHPSQAVQDGHAFKTIISAERGISSFAPTPNLSKKFVSQIILGTCSQELVRHLLRWANEVLHNGLDFVRTLCKTISGHVCFGRAVAGNRISPMLVLLSTERLHFRIHYRNAYRVLIFEACADFRSVVDCVRAIVSNGSVLNCGFAYVL